MKTWLTIVLWSQEKPSSISRKISNFLIKKVFTSIHIHLYLLQHFMHSFLYSACMHLSNTSSFCLNKTKRCEMWYLKVESEPSASHCIIQITSGLIHLEKKNNQAAKIYIARVICSLELSFLTLMFSPRSYVPDLIIFWYFLTKIAWKCKEASHYYWKHLPENTYRKKAWRRYESNLE